MKSRNIKFLAIVSIFALSLVFFAGTALAQETGTNPGAPDEPAATVPANRNWLQQMQEWMGPEAWGQMIQTMTQVHGAEFTGQMLQQMSQGSGCLGNGAGTSNMMDGDDHGFGGMMGGTQSGFGGMMNGAQPGYGGMMGRTGR